MTAGHCPIKSSPAHGGETTAWQVNEFPPWRGCHPNPSLNPHLI
ncbi:MULTISPECIES: hypothetical protein [unclassified Corynebacterium]|nr:MULTISPECIES: hypothetical protein [unclassified Corynebacterium]MDK8452521.1 hypothetical protein [Corynebacterium sp. MSK084]MDK8467619.1 hypothetical protein [Corynebacterium sp. MSK130]MDK8475614.1 hypothetical protein [Corynebacterium sp. MSK310]MDK8491267.1 hypothetical protein [Corynebacterium sp. MSK175]MDK8514250.1 hypothetical protein [Corynebacterium sp. MSK123]